MRTRHVTVAEIRFLINAQIKQYWGWSATFSCNARGRVWRSTRCGPTPEHERNSMNGVRALLDEIVDDVLYIRPRGGRFHINHQGVFMASDSRQVTNFLLRT